MGKRVNFGACPCCGVCNCRDGLGGTPSRVTCCYCGSTCMEVTAASGFLASLLGLKLSSSLAISPPSPDRCLFYSNFDLYATGDYASCNKFYGGFISTDVTPGGGPPCSETQILFERYSLQGLSGDVLIPFDCGGDGVKCWSTFNVIPNTYPVIFVPRPAELDDDGNCAKPWRGFDYTLTVGGTPADPCNPVGSITMHVGPGPCPMHAPAPTASPRQGRRCLFLADRTEQKAGCGGYNCRHNCELGLPAVPGAYCQTCKFFDDDGPYT
jgi:hypothetical protein